ncbi:MAG: prenyltransferase/squalene oxidase repeat-containing protein [Planctomycetota bacterium]|jgi:prenyltransferase beta subunit
MKRFFTCSLGLLLASAMALPAQSVRRFPPGVNAKIDAAIKRGLDYLVRTQNNDGSWRASGYGAYPTAMTALAGMALLGSGSTPTRGRHWQAVRKATNFLIKCAQPDGVITVVAEEGRSMYGHGFSTMFLAQVYGMEVDARLQKKLHKVLTKAVALICKAQSGAGGWYYTPDSRSDEGSVTVTQIQSLRACRNAGIVVPKKTIDRAVGYIRKSANSDGGISYSMHGGGSRPPITAAAVAVLYNSGKYDDPVAKKALKYAVRHLPVNGSGNGHHYYAQLYLAQALYQTGDARWDKHFRKMSKWLLRVQQKDGAWRGDGVGNTYGTAIACTILQLPYALVPIYQR